MTAPGKADAGRCKLVGGDKLPAGTGGSSAICAEVERAVGAQAPGVRYSVEVKVLSPSRLAATLLVNGRTLPVQNFAVMDRNLSDTTIQRFARSLADVVAKAAQP